MKKITIQIITLNNDGAIAHVTEQEDFLNIKLVSQSGNPIDQENNVPKTKLFDWLESRQDW